MKWIAAVLMIINVGTYLWASGRQINVDTRVIDSGPDVNKEGMLLLSEVVSLKVIGEVQPRLINNPEQLPATGALLQGGVGEGYKTTPLEDAAVASLDAGVVDACFRVGPFKKSDSWQSAVNWMKQQGMAFTHVSSDVRELRAVRVFLGPYVRQSEIDSVIKLLQQKGLEYFSKTADGSTRISLGYFTQEELATKFISHLRSINIEASSASEYRKLGPFNWMEVSANGIKHQDFFNRDWNEPGIDLLKLDC